MSIRPMMDMKLSLLRAKFSGEVQLLVPDIEIIASHMEKGRIVAKKDTVCTTHKNEGTNRVDQVCVKGKASSFGLGVK